MFSKTWIRRNYGGRQRNVKRCGGDVVMRRNGTGTQKKFGGNDKFLDTEIKDFASVKADGSNPLLTDFADLKLQLCNHTNDELKKKNIDNKFFSKVNAKLKDVLNMLENYQNTENIGAEIETVHQKGLHFNCFEEFDQADQNAKAKLENLNDLFPPKDKELKHILEKNELENGDTFDELTNVELLQTIQDDFKVMKDNFIKLSSTDGEQFDDSQTDLNEFKFLDPCILEDSDSDEDTVSPKVKFKDKSEKLKWINCWYTCLCFGLILIILLFGLGYFQLTNILKSDFELPATWSLKNYGFSFPDLGLLKPAEKLGQIDAHSEVNLCYTDLPELIHPGIETDRKWTKITVTRSKSIFDKDAFGFTQLQLMLLLVYIVSEIITKALVLYIHQKYFEFIHMLLKWIVPRRKWKKPITQIGIQAAQTLRESRPEEIVSENAKTLRKSLTNLLHDKVTAELNNNDAIFYKSKAIIPGYANGQPITILIDCGAGVSLITSKLLQPLEIKKVNDYCINLAGVATNNVSTSGQAKVKLHIGGIQNTVFINVMDTNQSINYDMLLGWDLFEYFPAFKIDAANKTIQMGNTKVEINLACYKHGSTTNAKIVRGRFLEIPHETITAEANKNIGQNGNTSMVVTKRNFTAEMNMFSGSESRTKISIFDGSPTVSFSDWIKKLKLILLSEPFPPNDCQKLAFLLLHLDGKAESAYKAMNDDDKNDFEKVVAHLKETFPSDGVKKHAENELLKCYQDIGENVHQFSNRLSKIVHSALQGEPPELIEKYLFRELFARLHPELQLKVRKEEPDNYEKLIKIATKIEDYQAAKTEFKKSKSSKAPVAAQHLQINGKPRRCYNCQEVGHEKVDCQNAYKPRSRPKRYVEMEERRCYNCQEIGHEKVDCPNPYRPRSRSPNIYSSNIPNWYPANPHQQPAYLPHPYFYQCFHPGPQRSYHSLSSRLLQQPQITEAEYDAAENVSTPRADYNSFDAESSSTHSTKPAQLQGHENILARERKGV